MAAVVEDERAPVLVLAHARVLVFVERGAVEADQAVAVLREVPGHPVEDHADAGLVAGVDEELEVLGRAEAARRREEPRHLVAPRPGERVLHHRQQLDVGEAHAPSRTGRAARRGRGTSSGSLPRPRRHEPRWTS